MAEKPIEGNAKLGYVRATWRLIHSPVADGETNMAVDEAILHAVASRRVPPTLRFYAWAPPCLSLGRGQSLEDINLQAVQAHGYGLVRRPTGGRAILHVDELTYSVVLPADDPRVADGIVGSYRRLSGGLVHGLERMGVSGIVADRRVENHDLEGPACFEVPSHYEITVCGRKLVGSAQMRAHRVVLQHGSLPLRGDIARICPLLAAQLDPDRVRARATTLEESLHRYVSHSQAAAALTHGFAYALNLELVPGKLTSGERDQAKALRVDKYATDDWIARE
jgi:lipoate-protein ligase A